LDTGRVYKFRDFRQIGYVAAATKGVTDISFRMKNSTRDVSYIYAVKNYRPVKCMLAVVAPTTGVPYVSPPSSLSSLR